MTGKELRELYDIWDAYRTLSIADLSAIVNHESRHNKEDVRRHRFVAYAMLDYRIVALIPSYTALPKYPELVDHHKGGRDRKICQRLRFYLQAVFRIGPPMRRSTDIFDYIDFLRRSEQGNSYRLWIRDFKRRGIKWPKTVSEWKSYARGVRTSVHEDYPYLKIPQEPTIIS